jgi:hypothetical protein
MSAGSFSCSNTLKTQSGVRIVLLTIILEVIKQRFHPNLKAVSYFAAFGFIALMIADWSASSEVRAQSTPTASPTVTATPASTPVQVSQADLLLLQAQLQNQAQQLQQAQQDALDSKNSAGAAVTLSLVAILFGLVGLVVAALAILRSRSSGRSGASFQGSAGSEVEGG